VELEAELQQWMSWGPVLHDPWDEPVGVFGIATAETRAAKRKRRILANCILKVGRRGEGVVVEVVDWFVFEGEDCY